MGARLIPESATAEMALEALEREYEYEGWYWSLPWWRRLFKRKPVVEDLSNEYARRFLQSTSHGIKSWTALRVLDSEPE